MFASSPKGSRASHRTHPHLDAAGGAEGRVALAPTACGNEPDARVDRRRGPVTEDIDKPEDVTEEEAPDVTEAEAEDVGDTESAGSAPTASFVRVYELCPRRTEEREGAQAEFGAEVARQHIDQRGVAAMGVVEDELFESAGGDAGAEVAHDSQKSLRAHRKRAGKAEVLVALAVADGRQRVDGQIGGNDRQRFAEQQIVDQRVGGQRQMMAVLLDGGGGQAPAAWFRGAARRPASK